MRDFKCVPRLVEQQAAIGPDAAAVSSATGLLTYKQLNDRASVLANHLRNAGVTADVPVALCIQSSIAMVVGALGILKAGAAYLPLDPAYPAQRLSYILNDAKTPIVVTSSESANSVPDGGWRVIRLENDGSLANGVPAGALPDPDPDALAYVIYTSGSSGQPKGVEITHGNLMNLISWHREAFSIRPSDRASQLAGVGFDAAVWEIWPYLTTGASLHIPDGTTRTEPESLRDWLLAKGITTSFIPTAMAERVLKLEWPAHTPLRTVLTGADVLHQYPSPRLPFVLVNNYGPTECTVVATSGVVLPNNTPQGRPPIGKAIANTRVYILDEQLRQVPAGTAGELHIGGAGVGRGYRNRPELTAEKFITDPFRSEPGARLYKTGDLAQFLPDGQIAFIGRIDEQIKIRGFRIEPNEIVTVLNRYPSILESAVVAREFGHDDKRLIAYFVPSAQEQPTYEGLQEFLRANLPDYMVPAALVQVERLPLTAHGKVDRAALPEPTAENTLAEEVFQGPRTPVEERVAALLMNLLDVDRLAVDDNFFHLGGHSLLGAQVIARVRETFDVQLSLRTLFDHPTIEGIAEQIDKQVLAKLAAA